MEASGSSSSSSLVGSGGDGDVLAVGEQEKVVEAEENIAAGKVGTPAVGAKSEEVPKKTPYSGSWASLFTPSTAGEQRPAASLRTATVASSSAASAAGGSSDDNRIGIKSTSDTELPPVVATTTVSPVEEQRGIAPNAPEADVDIAANLNRNGRFDSDGLSVLAGAFEVLSLGNKVGGGVPLRQRGLTNTGNSCFRSAVLQALMSCDPFVGPIREAAPLLATAHARRRVPAWAQFAAFLSEFEPPRPGARSSASDTGPVNPEDTMGRLLGAFGHGGEEQQDAEEFLNYFLDVLHEEQQGAAAELDESVRGSLRSPTAASSVNGAPAGVQHSAESEERDEWSEVTRGGQKTRVNRQFVAAKRPRSLVAGVFQGMIRSEVRRGAKGAVSANVEPFFSLQLDLERPGGGGEVRSLDDALSHYFAGEELADGVKGGRGANTTVRASRGVLLESLPRVIIFHLKQFYFDPRLGPRKRGCKLK